MKKILVLVLLVVLSTGAHFFYPGEEFICGCKRVVKQVNMAWSIPDAFDEITTVSNWSDEYKTYVVKELRKEGYKITKPAHK